MVGVKKAGWVHNFPYHVLKGLFPLSAAEIKLGLQGCIHGRGRRPESSSSHTHTTLGNESSLRFDVLLASLAGLPPLGILLTCRCLYEN